MVAQGTPQEPIGVDVGQRPVSAGGYGVVEPWALDYPRSIASITRDKILRALSTPSMVLGVFRTLTNTS